MPRPLILVTDGEQRSALAVTRSLGRAGWQVHVASASGHSLAGASRHSRAEHRVPSPLEAPAAFAAEVRRIAAGVGADVLLPVTDPSIQALLDAGAAEDGPRMPLPDPGAYHTLSDKRRARELARRVGIAVPDQWVLESPDAGLPEGVAFPVVVKPSRSVVEEHGALVKTGVAYADTPDELGRVLARVPAAAHPVLIQQRIVGVGEGQFFLRWDGEVRAAFAHRRLREKPPTGGQSVHRESVALEPGLLESSRRLLEAVDWQGVAMVEYKREIASGRSYLMEVNGRFWGSLQLAIDAGVDFPRLLMECVLPGRAAAGGSGAPRSPGTAAPAYRIGARSRWLWGDVDHLIARRKVPREALPPGQPTGLRFALGFLRPPIGRDRLEVLRISDPRPFLRETVQWFGSLGG